MRCLILCCFLFILPADAANPKVLLQESFTTAELSPDWFWGLGTWEITHGILRGFESGPRRHGPVKMRRLTFKDATIECGFRLTGKATFAGIIFNGSQDRGHLVHLVMGRDHVRVLAHPSKGQNVELVKIPAKLSPEEWHHVKLQFQNQTLIATIDSAQTITATHPCIAEQKQTFGLGGDSGGPEGEKAGTLEFRSLLITQPAHP